MKWEERIARARVKKSMDSDKNSFLIEIKITVAIMIAIMRRKITEISKCQAR